MSEDVFDASLSFQSMIKALEPGEHCTIAREIETGEMSMAAVLESIPAAKERLRNSIQPKTARARAYNPARYTTEIGEMTLPGGRMFVVAVITRVE